MNWKHIGGHLLFWAVIMLTYALSEWGYRDNFWEAIIFELLFLPPRLVAVYANWFVLIPKWLYKNRIIPYLLLLTLMLFVLAVLQRYIVLYWGYPTFFPKWTINAQPINPWVFFRIVQNIVIIISPVAFSTVIKIFIDWYDEKKRTKQLILEKREAELNYLKSQINPHFLFNTLNNLYGLSLEQSKKVPNLILKLSDFLNYSLYESTNDKIEVRKEIKLIEDFVALERERYDDRVQINWDIDDTIFTFKIAPLLFIPLVENAFKHGVREELQSAQVDISLCVEKEWVVFRVKNTISRNEDMDAQTGIGLKNLKRRLTLLYPSSHQLAIREDEKNFFATLKLSLPG